MNSPFFFSGELPASKSMLMRLLMITSYARGSCPVLGTSSCDDVIAMRRGLRALSRAEPADCGASAATLRFLALKAARMKGRHVLVGTSRLFDRPHEQLVTILDQLGVKASLVSGHQSFLVVESDGWQMPRAPLRINAENSSQFASAMLLNAWDLPFSLELTISERMVSGGYFEMTKTLVERAGMKVECEGDRKLYIEKNQHVLPKTYETEIDIDCAFAVAALAAVSGKAEIRHFPRVSIQPDANFVDHLMKLGCSVSFLNGTCVVRKAENLQPLTANLVETPDLFPILATLCACAEGRSHLTGAPQLVHKESNRVKKIEELLRLMGRETTIEEGGIVVEEKNGSVSPTPTFFSPDEDHRMAIAAAVVKRAGYPIDIGTPQVVNKSFPGFWSILEGS